MEIINWFQRNYHVSPIKNLRTLKPQVPSKLLLRDNPFENTTITRVSFAPSIRQCLLGLQLADNDFGTSGKITLYVYQEAEDYQSKQTNNQTIIDNKYVFDAEITNELWYTSLVNVKLVGEITVYKEVIKEIVYKPLLPESFKPTKTSYLRADGTLLTYERKFIYIKYVPEFVYHGTPVNGLQVFEPSKTQLFSHEPYVFAGDYWASIPFTNRWTDRDIRQGMIDGKPYLKEVQKNSFKNTFIHGGWIHKLSGEHFLTNIRLTNFEYISKLPAKSLESVYIKDPLKHLEEIGVKLINYKHSVDLGILGWK